MLDLLVMLMLGAAAQGALHESLWFGQLQFAGFTLHPQVARIVQDRNRMAAGEIPMDWGFAEMLAYASLLKAGYRIRLTGQDSRRGTFFHRHAALHDQGTGETHVLLENLSERRRMLSSCPASRCSSSASLRASA